MRNLKMTLRYEGNEYVLEKPLFEIDHSTTTPEEIASYNKHSDDAMTVACIMVAIMALDLAKLSEDY